MPTVYYLTIEIEGTRPLATVVRGKDDFQRDVSGYLVYPISDIVSRFIAYIQNAKDGNGNIRLHDSNRQRRGLDLRTAIKRTGSGIFRFIRYEPANARIRVGDGPIKRPTGKRDIAISRSDSRKEWAQIAYVSTWRLKFYLWLPLSMVREANKGEMRAARELMWLFTEFGIKVGLGNLNPEYGTFSLKEWKPEYVDD